jgi:hypothetical protein
MSESLDKEDASNGRFVGSAEGIRLLNRRVRSEDHTTPEDRAAQREAQKIMESNGE